MSKRLLCSALVLVFTSVSLWCQTEESAMSSDEQLKQEYNDTWRTPYITDDMTIDPEQHKSWRMGDYKFPSKPKDSWEFGVHGGHFFINGDVDNVLPGGFGAGIHLRKSLNYTLSLRGSLFYGKAKGLETQPYRHRNRTDANGIGGGLFENVYDPYDPEEGGPGLWFPSYQTTYVAAHFDIVFNLGNILFHQERNKWSWYASLGIGLDHHEARLDLLDGSGLPYMDLVNRINWTREEFDTRAGRQRIMEELEGIYDGVYETEGFKKAGVFRIGDDFNIHVVMVPSVGFARKINKRLNIGIEHKVFLSDNDYLDGIKYRTAVDQTNNLDVGHYTHLVIGINLGNFEHVTEPLYWLNPLDAAFEDIAELKSQPKLDLSDEDEDGVIDLLDKELDTKPDCPVDTHGVILDSDGDGIVDCEDKEPYSKPGCPVDEDGVSECGDEIDEDQINRLIDAKTEELRNAMLIQPGQDVRYADPQTFPGPDNQQQGNDEPGRSDRDTDTRRDDPNTGIIVTDPVTGEPVDQRAPDQREGQRSPEDDRVQPDIPPGDVPSRNVPPQDKSHATGPYTTYVRTGCGDWFLPMIHFDLNKSYIKPQFYSHIHNVAQVMMKCPEVCVVAQGHTDSRHTNEYNRVLSYKRAKAAVDYLVDRYGIDRSRLKLMYGGEEQPLVRSAHNAIQHYMNRRVEFRTCEPDDYDMPVPESYVPDGSAAPDSTKPVQSDKTSGY